MLSDPDLHLLYVKVYIIFLLPQISQINHLINLLSHVHHIYNKSLSLQSLTFFNWLIFKDKFIMVALGVNELVLALSDNQLYIINEL